MVSLFGTLSIIVFLICAGTLVLHSKLINKRSNTEVFFSNFDNLLRERLELYIDLVEDLEETDTAFNGTEIFDICESYLTAEIRQIIKAWVKIDKATNQIKSEIEKNEALTTNGKEIAFAIKAYNDNTALYNNNIKKLPWNIIAFAVGFKELKPIREFTSFD